MKKPDFQVTKNNELDDADLNVDAQIDWNEVKNIAEVEEEEKEDAKRAPKREDPYAKDLPFAGNQSLLIHKLLRERNHEYVFFVNESGTKEVGVFIVLIEALMYKKSL